MEEQKWVEQLSGNLQKCFLRTPPATNEQLRSLPIFEERFYTERILNDFLPEDIKKGAHLILQLSQKCDAARILGKKRTARRYFRLAKDVVNALKPRFLLMHFLIASLPFCGDDDSAEIVTHELMMEVMG